MTTISTRFGVYLRQIFINPRVRIAHHSEDLPRSAIFPFLLDPFAFPKVEMSKLLKAAKEMTDTTYNNSDFENTRRFEAKQDGEVDRLIDEAAMKFARLFLDQCMYAKQPQDREISSIDSNGKL